MLQKTFIFAHLVRKCRNARDILQGRRIHAQVLDNGLIQDRFISNLLVEMYGKCGSVEEARGVFDGIEDPNLFSWTNMFTAYAQNGHLQQAREIFTKMPEKDQVSWNAMIQAYACNGDITEAKRLFDSMVSRDVISWTTVLSAFAQNGRFEDAKAMFERMPLQDVVSKNAMMNALSQRGHTEEAFALFESIPERDVSSWTTMLAANAHKELQKTCEWFQRMPMYNAVAWTTMFFAYAQSGNVSKAREAFSRLPERHLIEWNAMVQAYAQNGHAEEALFFFSLMELEGVNPNSTTFLSVLTACNHIGLVELGVKYFLCMVEDHRLRPTHQHVCSLIDVLARAGWLREAEELANEAIPVSEQLVVLKSLSGACNLHGDVLRGESIARRVLEFHSEIAAPYVMLSNVYSQDKL